MLLNIALYAFAAIGVLVTLLWIVDCIEEHIGKESPPRAIPRPYTPKVQLGALTPSLLEKLYKLEYAALPIADRRDPKANLPKDAFSYPNFMSGQTCNYLLDAIDYIRHKRGVYPLEIAAYMDDRLRRAIDQHQRD